MKVSCRTYVEVTDPEDLLTLNFDALPQPLFVMGGGSNLLFTKDFPGTVLHLCNKGYTILPDSLVRVGAPWLQIDSIIAYLHIEKEL